MFKKMVTIAAATFAIVGLLAGSSIEACSYFPSPMCASARTDRARICAAQRRTIFSALEYAGMPTAKELILHRIERLYVVYSNLTRTGPPDEAAMRKIVHDATRENPQPTIVIDLEVPEFPFDIRTSARTAVDKTMAYVSRLIDAARAENPRAKVGVYGAPPLKDYWAPNHYVLANRLAGVDPWWKAKLPQAQAAYAAWTEANAYLKPLADKVDATFPSFYVLYDEVTDRNTPNWEIFADMLLGAARKYGKPVHPFVWPQFHNAGAHKDYRYLPSDDWTKVICYTLSYADGFVVWGWGGFRREVWDEDAAWWQAVLRLSTETSPGR